MRCDEGKQRLASWAEGEAIIERIIAENIEAGLPSKSIGLAAYRCDECGAWHVGHSGNDSLRGRVRAMYEPSRRRQGARSRAAIGACLEVG